MHGSQTRKFRRFELGHRNNILSAPFILSIYDLKNEVLQDMSTFIHRLSNPQPLLGVGDETHNYVKSTLDYPNNTCQSPFDNSESF